MDERIKRIPFGTMTHKKQTVFLAIVCEDVVAYGGVVCPGVLMINRSDGRFSFPGGGVEEGESLIDAIYREAKEEINFEITPGQISPVCSHRVFTVDMHLYFMTVGFNELVTIQKNAFEAKHFGSEVVGTAIVQIIKSRSGMGVPNFLQNNFVKGVIEQFFVLTTEIGLMNKGAIKQLYQMAGRNIVQHSLEIRG